MFPPFVAPPIGRVLPGGSTATEVINKRLKTWRLFFMLDHPTLGQAFRALLSDHPVKTSLAPVWAAMKHAQLEEACEAPKTFIWQLPPRKPNGRPAIWKKRLASTPPKPWLARSASA